MAMYYEIVDLDGGDVLGAYVERDKAVEYAAALLEQSPELESDIAVMAFETDGRRIGEPEVIHAGAHDAQPA